MYDSPTSPSTIPADALPSAFALGGQRVPNLETRCRELSEGLRALAAAEAELIGQTLLLERVEASCRRCREEWYEAVRAGGYRPALIERLGAGAADIRRRARALRRRVDTLRVEVEDLDRDVSAKATSLRSLGVEVEAFARWQVPASALSIRGSGGRRNEAVLGPS